MNGMPIQYLNGIDNDNNLVGLLGLDGSAEDDKKIYNHLIATRDSLINNPSQVKSIQKPTDMLKMLNYAIQYWNTPNRYKALDILVKEEERLIQAGAILTGTDENNQPLQGFFSKIKDTVKSVVQKVGNKIKDATITAIPASAKVFDVAKTLVSKKKPTTSASASTNTANASTSTSNQSVQQASTSVNTNTQNKMPDTMENPNPGFVEKYLTQKNLIIGGVVLAAGFIGYKMLSKKDQPKAIPSGAPALNGVRRKRKSAKRKPAAKAKPTRKARTRTVRTVKVR